MHGQTFLFYVFPYQRDVSTVTVIAVLATTYSAAVVRIRVFRFCRRTIYFYLNGPTWEPQWKSPIRVPHITNCRDPTTTWVANGHWPSAVACFPPLYTFLAVGHFDFRSPSAVFRLCLAPNASGKSGHSNDGAIYSYNVIIRSLFRGYDACLTSKSVFYLFCSTYKLELPVIRSFLIRSKMNRVLGIWMYFILNTFARIQILKPLNISL